MTNALCLNCGEVKFGALCPCPSCSASNTGDINLDIAFSDHHIATKSLEELGQVIAAIHEISPDPQLCFWTFIRYVSIHHSSILGVNLESELQAACDDVLSRIDLPDITLQEPKWSVESDDDEDGTGQ